MFFPVILISKINIGSRSWSHFVFKIKLVLQLTVVSLVIYYFNNILFFSILFPALILNFYHDFSKISSTVFNRTKLIWSNGILITTIICFWSIILAFQAFREGHQLEIYLTIFYSVTLMARIGFDFRNFVISQNHNLKNVEIPFNEGSLMYLLPATTLLLHGNLGIWFLMSSVIIADYIISRSELNEIPQIGSVHQFNDFKPLIINRIGHLLIPMVALFTQNENILICYCLGFLCYTELKKNSSWLFYRSKPNVGLFVMNWNYYVWDYPQYEHKVNEWQKNDFHIQFSYRYEYLFGKTSISLSQLIERSEYTCFCIEGDLDLNDKMFIDLTPLVLNMDEIGIHLLSAIRSPYKIVDLVLIKPLEGSTLEKTDPRKRENVQFQESPIDLFFLLSYLDEKPAERGYLIIDSVDLPTIELNRKIKNDVENATGFDINKIYDKGLTPLLILHRRTHEFSMISVRFMELLNILEVAVRWINIFERNEDISQGEDIHFTFGTSVGELRKLAFANEILFNNHNELSEYKELLRNSFGLNQKENQAFRVIDFLNWVVFIRNKTRGHGSPSRVNYQLYKMVEINTIRLFKSIAEFYDPEILIYKASENELSITTDGLSDTVNEYYCYQRGMNFHFQNKYSGIPEGYEKEKLLFKTKQSKYWRTSNELKFEKDNIYLLNSIKKNKYEWICYNTGELIRPDIIFSI